MKILLINTLKDTGGAAIAANNLYLFLKKNNMDVDYCNADNNIFPIVKNKYFEFLLKILKKLLPRTSFKTTNNILHSKNHTSSINVKSLNKSDYDIVHLHWINFDFISIEDIGKITKPIVWTLHDGWTYCGAEHHPNFFENDNRFIEGYSKANKPKSTKGPDICRITWNRKKKAWKNTYFVFISPSKWNADRLKTSKLFHNSKCTVIPNIIDQSIFKKLDQQTVRTALGLPQDIKIIGFGAAYDINTDKSIKGSRELISALSVLKSQRNFHLVVFGPYSAAFQNSINSPCTFMGKIDSPQIVCAIYNSLDVFVCPSIMENLPTTCIEAQFCGIPVTAFDVGGIPEIIKHKETGYLAKPYDIDDLANGIKYCIENKEVLSKKAIKLSSLKFDNDIITKKHISLYEEVLKSSHRS